MACASCAKKKENSYQDFKAIESPPFRATDIITYDIENDTSNKFSESDYDIKKINVLLFVPTVDVIKEIGSSTLVPNGVDITYVTNQPLHQIKDYYENGGERPKQNVIFVSYLLPARANLLYNGNSRKAIAYIAPDGNFIVQQLFYNGSFDYEAISKLLQEYLDDNHKT